MQTVHEETEEILKFFDYRHLPDYLQPASIPFFELAHDAVRTLVPSHELVAFLRKMLEAKDCLVRARIIGLKQ